MLLSKRNLKWLNKEFQTLRDEDIISDFQLEAIHAFYQARFKENRKRALKLTGIMGVILIGLILFLWIAIYK